MLNLKIKNEIQSKIFSTVDDLTTLIFSPSEENNYFKLISTLEETTKTMIKNIIISVFEEFDLCYKNSVERSSNYYINKSYVPRTIVTIFGSITFKRHTLNTRQLAQKCFT